MSEFYRGGLAQDLDDIDVLSDDQQCVINVLSRWWKHDTSHRPYYVIGGVAGSGKSTVIAWLADELGVPQCSIAYCAFTGKAALVLRRKGIEAKTIHRTIYTAIRYADKTKVRYEFKLKDDLKEYIRLIVIDEGSMIGDKLWSDLLALGIPIIVFGDHQQLPPIQGRLNLMDEAGFTMNNVLRQLEGSPILQLAQKAISGERIPIGEFGDGVRRVFANDLSDDDYKSFQQVVVGTNKNRISINEKMRKIFQYDKDLNCDERLVVTANNAKYNLFNGQIIYLTRDAKVNKDSFRITFIDEYERDEVVFAVLAEPRTCRAVLGVPRDKHLDKRYQGCIHIDYGYAITAHRAQGSSWKNVMVYDDGFGKWNNDDTHRRWLYTCITRAEEKLTIVVPSYF